MPVVAKAMWRVQAGVIPDTVIPEFTKEWWYTSRDYEEDGLHAEEPQYETKFNQLQFRAMSYHLQMSNPRLNNWAQLSFIWY